MEPRWLKYAKRLQSLALTGLQFTKNDFDRERFEEIAQISNEMMANLGTVPIARIQDLVSDFAKGYVTPRVDVRGAIIRGDTVLLVREKSDGRWTMPGGFADVGFSPAQNVEREILEEAGITATATRLYGVRYKSAHRYNPDIRDFYKLFFLCEATDLGQPTPGLETSEVSYFKLDELPELSTARTLEEDIAAAFMHAKDARLPTYFD